MKQTKTVEQWLKELPEEFNPKINVYNLNYQVTSFSESIIYGIDWHDSEEGVEFYCSLYESLKWAEEE